jgi:hypothetical protein
VIRREFENAKFEEFCHSYGIQQEFSSPIIPQQNGVVDGSSDDPLKESCSTFLGRS